MKKGNNFRTLEGLDAHWNKIDLSGSLGIEERSGLKLLEKGRTPQMLSFVEAAIGLSQPHTAIKFFVKFFFLACLLNVRHARDGFIVIILLMSSKWLKTTRRRSGAGRQGLGASGSSRQILREDSDNRIRYTSTSPIVPLLSLNASTGPNSREIHGMVNLR